MDRLKANRPDKINQANMEAKEISNNKEQEQRVRSTKNLKSQTNTGKATISNGLHRK